ncbi:cardiolipin synthase [Paenibacillus agilis]|uniref:Cardiolipin synthase n=1 Tax=Paenibacillus agilis TaxID=3020863 RepID=A0A559IW26_9BACL|nr:cardiolipin synthase [Paenibacillus agilis]TVX91813.1 cardiolipin synthase [Paenibacillus agilis]
MLWVVAALVIYIFQLVMIVFLEHKHPSKTVAWLLISFCFPLIGFVLYYFVAQDYTARRRVRNNRYEDDLLGDIKRINKVTDLSSIKNESMRMQPRLFGLVSALSNIPVTGGNRTIVLTNGQETYNALIEGLKSAKHHIHMEFYIIRDDVIGRIIQELLIQKASEGVQVRVIADGVGSLELNQVYVSKLQQAGVEFHFFLPLAVSLFRRRLNYRNHRKIVVVDGRIGYVGGLNIGDEYAGKHEKLGFWRDTHLQIEGDAVYALQAVFLHDWSFASGQKLWQEEFFPLHQSKGDEQVKMISSGPDANLAATQELFFGALVSAQERIWMMTPYFVPDLSIRLALKTAAMSGIDVRIIIPYQSDSKIVDWAARSYLEELMKAGVKFFEYQKGFCHAKTLIIDQALACIGTANMDMRSFYWNFELNAVMFDRKTIHRLEADFSKDFDVSSELEYHHFTARPRKQRMMEAISRMLSPLL